MTHTVLYIEDDEDNIHLAKRLLDKLRPDISLIVAKTGEEGVRIAHEDAFSLILLDLRLPDMRGEEVIRHIHTDPIAAMTPVVIFSGQQGSEQVAEVLKLGAADFLPKPFYPVQLMRIVDKFCAL